MDLVSFCIPVYNAEHFIDFTLKSILYQSHTELEVIIIDDHSTDSTSDIVTKFNDHRIKLHKAIRKGAAAARNQALNLAKGKYIVFFDADDWIPENFLTTQINCLRAENEIVVCKWGRFYNNDINTIEINTQQIRRDLDFKNWIVNYWYNNTSMTCPGRVLMTKSLTDKVDKWDETLSLNDDFQYYSMLFSKSSKIRFNNNSMFYYRSGINGLSSIKGEKAYQSLYKSINIGIDIAIKQFQDDVSVKKACANLLKSFIYEAYPKQSSLISEAKLKIKLLGGADHEFPAGGKTKNLIKLLGWKLTKRLKNLL